MKPAMRRRPSGNRDMGRRGGDEEQPRCPPQTRPAHCLAGVRKPDARYSSRRAPRRTRTMKRCSYVNEDNMFYDIWSVRDKSLRNIAFENLWPLITGAATEEQAGKLIDNFVLNPEVFF